jgi:hypothetical protein
MSAKLKGWGIGDPIEITVRENDEGDIVFEDDGTEICLDKDDIPKLIEWLRKAAAPMTETVLACDPTTSDLPDGQQRVFRNTSNGKVSMWKNVGGLLQSESAPMKEKKIDG